MVLGVLILIVTVCVGFWARCVWRHAARRALEEEARSEATIRGLRHELAEVRLKAKALLRHKLVEAQLWPRPAEVGLMCGESGRAASEADAEGGAAGETVSWRISPLEITRLFGSWGGGENDKRVTFAATHYFRGSC
jgi:hypothetical protein